MAPFYAMTVPEFAAELGLPGHDVFDLEWHLSEGEGALITARAGLTPEVLKAMMFRGFISDVRMMIARKNRYRCPACLDDYTANWPRCLGDFVALFMVWNCATPPVQP